MPHQSSPPPTLVTLSHLVYRHLVLIVLLLVPVCPTHPLLGKYMEFRRQNGIGDFSRTERDCVTRPRYDRHDRFDQRGRREGESPDGREERHRRRLRSKDREIAPRITRIVIPRQCLQDELPRLFHSRVVLSFEGAYTDMEAKKWILDFNETSPMKLVF